MFPAFPGMLPGMIPPYPGMFPGMAPGMGPAWPLPPSAPPAWPAPPMSSAGYPGVPPPENVEGSRAKAKAKAKGKKSRGEDAGKAEEGSDKEKDAEEDRENDRKAAEEAEELLALFGTDPVGATASFVTKAFESTRSSKADQKLIESVSSKHNCKLFTYTTEQHKTQPLSKSIVEREAKAKFPN